MNFREKAPKHLPSYNFSFIALLIKLLSNRQNSQESVYMFVNPSKWIYIGSLLKAPASIQRKK